MSIETPTIERGCICTILNPPEMTPQHWVLDCTKCGRVQHRICMGLYGVRIKSAAYVCHLCSKDEEEEEGLVHSTKDGDEGVKSAHHKTRAALVTGRPIWKSREKAYWQDLPTERSSFAQ